MAISIYADRETLFIIDQLKKKDPNFNLSGFIKEALMGTRIYGTRIDAEAVKTELNRCIAETKILSEREEYLKKKLVEAEAQKIVEEQQREELIAKEENRKRIKEQQKKNIKEIFKEEIGRDMTEDEVELYFMELDDNKIKNVWQFCERFKNGNIQPPTETEGFI